MEQLQLAVMLWSSIGIAACMAVLCLLGWNKKRNPDFLTSRASPRDMLKARKIIIGFLGSFIIYALLFMFVIAHLAYAKIPMALIFLGTVFIGSVIIMTLSALKKSNKTTVKITAGLKTDGYFFYSLNTPP